MTNFLQKKSLGQHFLNDKKILRNIVSLVKICNENIIEIGPGKGALTEYILDQNPKKITLIEKDKRLKSYLEKIHSRNFKKLDIIFEDALKVDLRDIVKPKIILVANLPYNIATTLIINWMKYYQIFKTLLVMVQKEVADRLLAKVGNKSYGRVSVLIQSNASVELGFQVNPDAFYPKPKVLSSVIKITPFKRQYDYEILDKTLKLSFLHRRKILKNNLKNIDKITENKINENGINLSVRPQELKPNEFITLSEILFG